MRRPQDITPVIKNLMIIKLLVWVAELTFGNEFINLFSIHFYKSPDFRVWQPITYMFLHSPDFGHILFNMIGLWIFGVELEDAWGARRFLLYYLFCGIGAGIIQMAASAVEFEFLYRQLTDGRMLEGEFISRAAPIYHGYTLGASGAVMGVMAGFAYLFPNMPMQMFLLPIPIKAKYLVGGYILVDLFSGINPQYNTGIAHFAHVGGAVIGLILVITMNKSNRRTFY